MATRGRASSKRPDVDYDFRDEEYREPGEGYSGPEPTRGMYTAELVSVGDHTSQSENESIKWTFRLAEGSENKHGEDVSGWIGSKYTNMETAAWMTQQIAVALGLMKPNGRLRGTYDEFMKKAKPCRVRVGVERYIPDDGEGDAEWRGTLQAFLPLKGEAGGTTRKRRSRDDDEDYDEPDTDVDDTDDEEEEAPPPRRSRSRKAEPEPEPDDEDDDEEPEDDDDEPAEDYDPDELAEELGELTLVKLKARAKDEFKISAAKLRGKKADEIIDMIIDTLPEEGDADEEEEPEEEPEPPKRRARGSAAKSRPASRGRKRGSSDEPPF